MTPAQLKAVFSLPLGESETASERHESAERKLCLSFGADFRAEPERAVEVLRAETALRSAEGVEAALFLCARFKSDMRECLPTLHELLTELWHTRHEDVANELRDLKDPSSVTPLHVAATDTYRALPDTIDDGHAFARKCTWALARIDTPEAWDKLEALSHSPDPVVAAYAQKRLNERGRD